MSAFLILKAKDTFKVSPSENTYFDVVKLSWDYGPEAEITKGVSNEDESTDVPEGADSAGAWLKINAIVCASNVCLISSVTGRPRTGIN